MNDAPEVRPGRVRFALSGSGIMGWVAQAEVDPDAAPGLFQAWVDGGAWDLPKLGIGERFVVRRTLAPGWAIIPLWRTTWPPRPAPKDGGAMTPSGPFDSRARPGRRRPFAWTSRALAAAWLGVAWLALGAAFAADAAQKGLATVGIAVAIALVALGLAIGNWTGWIRS